MKKRAKVLTPTRVPMKRVPRPIIAMAAQSPDQPVTSIDRLKGGEINWSIKAPGPTMDRSIDRAIEGAKRLILECARLEALQATLRQERAAATVAAQEKAAQEKAKEEGGK